MGEILTLAHGVYIKVVFLFVFLSILYLWHTDSDRSHGGVQKTQERA